jgi:hypothetical protein
MKCEQDNNPRITEVVDDSIDDAEEENRCGTSTFGGEYLET